MNNSATLIEQIQVSEDEVISELNKLRHDIRQTILGVHESKPLTISQKVADTVAITIGSWKFIIIQSMLMLAWVILNVTAYLNHWDPYPFILLNLALSFQAAFAAPFIMMSQNRQQEIDRSAASQDNQINRKAELEIELLHSKIDAMRNTEIQSLIFSVQELSRQLNTTQK